MIPRPFTCCCAVLAIASGFFLYTKKHQTTLLDQQISKIVSDTQRVRAQTAMLRTEWALENQPERLTHLAEQHLTGLHPMEPTQFVRMADLEKHLPALAHGADVNPRPSLAVMADAATPAPAHPALAAVADTRPARPAAPAPAHVRTEEAAPAQPALVAENIPAKPAAPRPAVRAVIMHHDAAPTAVAEADTDVTPVAHTAPLRRPVQVAADTVKQAAPRPVPAFLAAATPAPVHRTPAVTRVAAVTPRPAASAESEGEQQVRHPLPVSVASWHATRARHTPATNAGYVEARANSSYSGGSLLGRGDDALPPPVPMTN
ncbi:MAG: cell division protein FtsL [Acetobacter cibinongensis]